MKVTGIGLGLKETSRHAWHGSKQEIPALLIGGPLHQASAHDGTCAPMDEVPIACRSTEILLPCIVMVHMILCSLLALYLEQKMDCSKMGILVMRTKNASISALRVGAAAVDHIPRPILANLW